MRHERLRRRTFQAAPGLHERVQCPRLRHSGRQQALAAHLQQGPATEMPSVQRHRCPLCLPVSLRFLWTNTEETTPIPSQAAQNPAISQPPKPVSRTFPPPANSLTCIRLVTFPLISFHPSSHPPNLVRKLLHTSGTPNHHWTVFLRGPSPPPRIQDHPAHAPLREYRLVPHPQFVRPNGHNKYLQRPQP